MDADPPCRSCPELEVFRWKRGSLTGETASVFLHECAQGPSEDLSAILPADYQLGIVLARANRTASANGTRDYRICRRYFTDVCHMPDVWWEDYQHRLSNGFFGCEDVDDIDGNMVGHASWLRAEIKNIDDEEKTSYSWCKLNTFVYWSVSTRQTIIIFFDVRPEIDEWIRGFTPNDQDTIGSTDPFWIYPLVLNHVVRLQTLAVWAVRNVVRNTEKERASPLKPRVDYPRLHDIARHAIHVSETLSVMLKTMESMLRAHSNFMDSYTRDNNNNNNNNTEAGEVKKAQAASRRIHSRLRFVSSMFSGLLARSSSNKERLFNEIGLAFNTVAQYDSRISVEIGRAQQSDSEAMKTIAFVTLTFLPATFISAVFSTSFFSFGSDGTSWEVSAQFWVYWAVAVPVTALTTLLWYYWPVVFPPRVIGETDVKEGVRRVRGWGGLRFAETLRSADVELQQVRAT